MRLLLGEELGGTRRVLIAPDGLLNLIPFAALVMNRINIWSSASPSAT
jgi:hypothetical protein